ncbi:uncharacterized protein BXZ73DRAFT_88813 [Epithele typhae]|uniref:uncharacterized protein n=1 Tax=Epithele typhae TaxID=378194 RepID=UPI002008D3F7|nr:uncharacterized protein BXZ73DRAFT_88813 [Epithele typhae]KAH9940093.1 hypothetical protein BXZ73DRAFT_88813 [Epithele typhae]
MEEPNAPARGRKRFQYDLQRAEQTVAQGVEVNGLRLLSVSPGEESGSFDCNIVDADGDLLATLQFLVSDQSEYPSDHMFFCSSQEDLPAKLASVTESMHDEGSLSIQDLLVRLLEKLSKKTSTPSHVAQKQGTSEDGDEEGEGDTEDDEDDYGMYDDEYTTLGVTPGLSKLDRFALQRDFNEIVGYGYRPGFIPFGLDDFSLSLSIPAKSLADTIPARALMAWDKRLLSQPRHLTLLISDLRGVWPVVQPDAVLSSAAHMHGAMPRFRVALSTGYKPTVEDAMATVRKFGLKEDYGVAAEAPVEDAPAYNPYDDYDEDYAAELAAEQEREREQEPEVEPEPEKEPEVVFQPFGLSSSLESLLDSHFLPILQFRIRYKLGWAGAETLRWEVETSQQPPGDIMRLRGPIIHGADVADEELAKSYVLPPDPLLTRNAEDPVNLPLFAFSYLLRRITLCPRFCLVCHQQLKEDLDALKPYVCSSKLCTYQYYNLNRGPSLEYEICANPVTVDLLLSLAYLAAAENVLDEPFPVGMGLRVAPKAGVEPDADGLIEFDRLNVVDMRNTIAQLIDQLPPIDTMKKYLEAPRKAGQRKPRLKDLDKAIPDAAWLVLRWCVASCTAYLEELDSEHEQIKNMGAGWRQFRFSVGAPDAEAKFRRAIVAAQASNANAKTYPSLYIIRHGLWYRTVAHGRAYGDGVYFAKDGSVSVGSYALGANSCWRNSASRIASCVALAEIVNLPHQFTSQNPYFVVKQTEWIMCRYLMIKGSVVPHQDGDAGNGAEDVVPYVPLDPAHPLTIAQKRIRIPDPSYALGVILEQRAGDLIVAEYDEDDMRIFTEAPHAAADPTSSATPPPERAARPEDDWQHDAGWVEECVQHLIPPPTESSTQATGALQRELQAMLREQAAAWSLCDLGWFIPEDLQRDNLYQWIVELHSFDPNLPVAKDMVAHGVNSLVFEIRFPGEFPYAPPFFRILKPRFLPFSQGGGGHITLGGSMCMDLLTASGWVPSYNIASVLLQIRLAISNLDPKPARLAHDWDRPYGMGEALEGYKRVAAVHGWKLPDGIDRLAY